MTLKGKATITFEADESNREDEHDAVYDLLCKVFRENEYLHDLSIDMLEVDGQKEDYRDDA